MPDHPAGPYRGRAASGPGRRLEHVRHERTCSSFPGAYRPSACLRQSVSTQRGSAQARGLHEREAHDLRRRERTGRPLRDARFVGKLETMLDRRLRPARRNKRWRRPGAAAGSDVSRHKSFVQRAAKARRSGFGRAVWHNSAQ